MRFSHGRGPSIIWNDILDGHPYIVIDPGFAGNLLTTTSKEVGE